MTDKTVIAAESAVKDLTQQIDDVARNLLNQVRDDSEYVKCLFDNLRVFPVEITDESVLTSLRVAALYGWMH